MMNKMISRWMLPLLLVLMTVACGGNDEPLLTGTNLHGSVAQLQGGTWELQSYDRYTRTIVHFNSDMTGQYTQYTYDLESGRFNQVRSASFNYSYEPLTGELRLSSGSGDEVWYVNALTDQAVTITVNGVVFTGTKTQESPTYAEEDYAPEEAVGYHFHCQNMLYPLHELDFYFVDNNSASVQGGISSLNKQVDPLSGAYYILQSATYEKTGANKAKIVFTYRDNEGNGLSETLTLVFYANGVGKVSGTLEGSLTTQQQDFTFVRESPAMVSKAPENVINKRFSPSRNTWYQFGVTSERAIEVTSFQLDANTSYYSALAEYVKTGNNTASMNIQLISTDTRYAPYDEYYQYELTFTSETSGYYILSKTTSNPQSSPQTSTGGFTLM